MFSRISCVFFLSALVSPALAIDISWCPEGTKTTVQLNQLSIAHLNHLQAGKS